MCGLLGHLGNKKNPVNLDKFNILGILNEERGEHSCGVTMDGEILKGIDGLKLYRDFVAYYKLLPPTYTTGMIGHTRKATFGHHTEENAHPFGFGTITLPDTKDPIYEFVGVHNGTLLNHTELANKTGLVPTKEVEEEIEEEIGGKKIKKTKIKTVTKIDSEILLERLFTDGDYRVLSEYNGAAALIWQDLSKPNTMYFYHGKSAKTDYDPEIGEERPLYYWKESKNSLYVSSILESLYVIGGTDKTIGEFTHNTVYEVKDGDIVKAKKTKIDRSANFRAKGYPTSRAAGFGREGLDDDTCNYPVNFHGCRTRWNGRMEGKSYRSTPISLKNGTGSQLQLNLEVPIDKGLLAEKFDYDEKMNNGLTMCKQLRYWRNGHLANGIFLYVNNFGFYHLGFQQKSSMEHVKRLAGQYWYDGDFHIKPPKNPLKTKWARPVDEKRGTKNAMSYLHYIHEGIRLKTYKDWQATSADAESGRFRFDLVALSIVACHPIIDLEESADKRIPGAYYGGTLADRTHSFLGSNKMYKFVAGQIRDISYIPGMEPEELSRKLEVNTLQRAQTFLEKSLKVNGYTTLEEKDLLRELVSLDKVIENISKESGAKILRISDEVEKRIDSILLTHFREANDDYNDVLKKLSDYKKASTKAALACDILTKLIQLD